MTNERPFFDTNVLLYILSDELQRSDQARLLVSRGGVISVQVLNEFVDVARRKFDTSWDKIWTSLESVRYFCEVAPLTLETHFLAMQLADRNKFRMYDATIIAAAEIAGCDTLFTEDLNHSQRIGNIIIRNPFA